MSREKVSYGVVGLFCRFQCPMVLAISVLYTIDEAIKSSIGYRRALASETPFD